MKAPRRRDHEPPAAIATWGWRFHHLGVPTTVPHPGERHLEQFGLHVAGFESSPFGIEWMRFDEGSPIPELIRTVPHLAFEVDDLAAALEGQEVLTPPNSPSEGVVVAMILHDGAPVELLQFDRRARPPRDEPAGHDGARRSYDTKAGDTRPPSGGSVAKPQPGG